MCGSFTYCIDGRSRGNFRDLFKLPLQAALWLFVEKVMVSIQTKLPTASMVAYLFPLKLNVHSKYMKVASFYSENVHDLEFGIRVPPAA